MRVYQARQLRFFYNWILRFYHVHLNPEPRAKPRRTTNVVSAQGYGWMVGKLFWNLRLGMPCDMQLGFMVVVSS